MTAISEPKHLKCETREDALVILAELSTMIRNDPDAVARVDAIERWIVNDRPVIHKNIRGKEYFMTKED